MLKKTNKTNNMVTIISLGIVFGAFFSFDLFFSAKRQGTFVRQLISLITVSIPAIYNAIFQTIKPTDNTFSELWFTYFYLSFVLTLFVFFFIALVLIYIPLMNKIERNKSEKLFTFFDFLYKGYSSFKNDLEKTFEEDGKYRESKEDTIIFIHNDLRPELIEFITETYETIEDSDIDGYLGYVLYGFVQRFMGECDARFTLRQLNSEKTKMITRFTTREDAMPGDIDISKKNMIKKSMELGKPLIYSENPTIHFKTTNNSIKKGVYEDYVSYCLLKTTDGKPYYSICLDVKGENAKKRMKAFVDSLIFDIICNAITLKILKNIDNEKNK
jgi:hypothetical protein